MTEFVPKFDGDVQEWIRRVVAFLERQVQEDRTPVGAVLIFATDQIPAGYLLCDGEEYLFADYPALGKYLADIWGAGSDSLHFVVPNLVDALLIGGEELDLATGGTAGSGAGIVTEQVVFAIKA